MPSDLAFHRGDLVVSVFQGDFGKPRPALVVQSDLFNPDHGSTVLCPLTSDLTRQGMFRVSLPAADTPGLRTDSEIMIDKMTVMARSRIRQRIGRLTPEQMGAVDQALRIWLDLPGIA